MEASGWSLIVFGAYELFKGLYEIVVNGNWVKGLKDIALGMTAVSVAVALIDKAWTSANWITLAIAGLVYLASLVVEHWNEIKYAVTEIWDALKYQWDGFVRTLKETWDKLCKGFKELWKMAVDAVVSVANNLNNSL